MTQRERILALSAIAFLLCAVLATAMAIYYRQEYASANQKYLSAQQDYMSVRESIIQVSVTIDYGNGTIIGDEAVYLSPNATVLDALKAVARVNATYWTEYHSFLVDAINGVTNNANGNGRWWVYSVNGEHALVSADQYRLEDGDQVEWKYEQS